MSFNRRHFMVASALVTPALATASSWAKNPSEATNTVVTGMATGADVLAAQRWRRLADRRCAVVSNPTGVLSNVDHIVDSMVAAGVSPVVVLGPEHGFRGSAQAGEAEQNTTDPRTGLPVIDAYGLDVAGVAQVLEESKIDTVVFDIADVGARFYTYIWTMYTAMTAAARVGAAFIVLDRPNPLGGKAAGPVLNPAFSSAVGRKPIAQQHGMTVGELARFFDAEFLPNEGARLSKLDIVELQGWKRERLFPQTGLPWVPPSPNMPTPETALLYPGTGMFEGTEFSEGRGTTRPFEVIGAPGVDWRWRDKLNEYQLAGVRFREHYFIPSFGKFAGKNCGGVHITITDPAKIDPIRTTVAMFVTAKQLYPNIFAWRSDNFIDKLFGSDRLRTMINAGKGVDEICAAWQAELAQFDKARQPYLIYG